MRGDKAKQQAVPANERSLSLRGGVRCPVQSWQTPSSYQWLLCVWMDMQVIVESET